MDRSVIQQRLAMSRGPSDSLQSSDNGAVLRNVAVTARDLLLSFR
jgi:hypothetical protein